MINFFISRPVFSWVLAIVAMLAGIMAIFVLPVQRYPSVAPPAVPPTDTAGPAKRRSP